MNGEDKSDRANYWARRMKYFKDEHRDADNAVRALREVRDNSADEEYEYHQSCIEILDNRRIYCWCMYKRLIKQLYESKVDDATLTQITHKVYFSRFIMP